MGKVVFWLVVVFVALFALRIVNAAKARGRNSGARPAPGGVPTVRCGECGVFLPRAEAIPAGDGFRCSEGCGARR
jgi:hypothetical protein